MTKPAPQILFEGGRRDAEDRKSCITANIYLLVSPWISTCTDLSLWNLLLHLINAEPKCPQNDGSIHCAYSLKIGKNGQWEPMMVSIYCRIISLSMTKEYTEIDKPKAHRKKNEDTKHFQR